MNSTECDRQHAYLKHRHRVECAKPLIDDHPPLLHAGNLCRFSKLKEDVLTSLTLNKRNAELLIAINKVARTKGVVDSFRTTENSLTTDYCKLPHKNRLLDEVDYENLRLGKKLLCMKGDLDTRLHSKYQRQGERKIQKQFQYPAEVLNKYSSIEVSTKEPKLLKKLLRPKIWFNLEVKDIRPLGRIIIELYTEAAPQVVLEFVRLSLDKEKERLRFVRLFPGLWLEGEISLNSKTLIQQNLEYDKRSLDHGQYSGVLSFSLDYIDLYEKGLKNFTISFKPLRVLNGRRRVGFGRVLKGSKVLNCIQDYGTKNGKPTKDIVIANCGVFL